MGGLRHIRQERHGGKCRCQASETLTNKIIFMVWTLTDTRRFRCRSLAIAQGCIAKFIDPEPSSRLPMCCPVGVKPERFTAGTRADVHFPNHDRASFHH